MNFLEMGGFLKDTIRIQKVLLHKGAIEASLKECEDIWQEYSGDLGAGWLGLPKDDQELFDIVRETLDKIIDKRLDINIDKSIVSNAMSFIKK